MASEPSVSEVQVEGSESSQIVSSPERQTNEEQPLSPLTPHDGVDTATTAINDENNVNNTEVNTDIVVLDSTATAKDVPSSPSISSKPLMVFNWIKAKFDTFRKPNRSVVPDEGEKLPVSDVEGLSPPRDDAIVKVEPKVNEDGAIIDVKVDPINPEKKEEGKKEDENENENGDGNKNKPTTREEDGILYDKDGNVIVVHGKFYMMFVKLMDNVSPKIAGKLRHTSWQVKTNYIEDSKNWLEQNGGKFPRMPGSWAHCLLLYDKCLYRYCPHWIRYFVYAGMWHVFPFAYGIVRAPKLQGQCSEDLVPWFTYTSYLSGGRIFLIGFMAAMRIRNRRWDGQNFGEAMGELLNPLTDSAEELDPVFMRGDKLILWRVCYHLAEFICLIVGWKYYTDIQVCDKEIMRTSLGLLCYQTFNLIVFSVVIDFVWSYVYMEWQKDIDTTTKHKKKPPKNYVKKKVRVDGGGGMDDDDNDLERPQLLLSADGMVDVNPYAEKSSVDDEAPVEHVVVDRHDLPKGDTAAQKAAKSGSRETHKMWSALSDPLATTNPSTSSKQKKVPKVHTTPLRKLGAAARKKITPEGGFFGGGEKQKKLPAGSDGNEWWREDSGMPTRKERVKNGKGGGQLAGGFGRRDESIGSRPKTAPSKQITSNESEENHHHEKRPKSSSGGRSKSPGKKEGSSGSKKKVVKEEDKPQRPKTPDSKQKQSSKSSPKVGKKKVNVRPSTAPNPPT